jgi:hypothetical protein
MGAERLNTVLRMDIHVRLFYCRKSFSWAQSPQLYFIRNYYGVHINKRQTDDVTSQTRSSKRTNISVNTLSHVAGFLLSCVQYTFRMKCSDFCCRLFFSVDETRFMNSR